MEEKTITIKMKGPRPERRVLKSWKFWAFIACALLEDVAIENLGKLEARKKAGTIDGDGDGIIR